MHENGHDFCPQHAVLQHPLTGADFALHDGIHRLEMAGVGGQADVHLIAGGGPAGVLESEVVFDVAVSTD